MYLKNVSFSAGGGGTQVVLGWSQTQIEMHVEEMTKEKLRK